MSRSLFRLTVVRKRCCSSLSGPGSPSSRMCSQPSIAASGVRSSCDTVATNWSFIRAAAASLRLRSAYWASCAAMVSMVSGWPSLRAWSEPTSWTTPATSPSRKIGTASSPGGSPSGADPADADATRHLAVRRRVARSGRQPVPWRGRPPRLAVPGPAAAHREAGPGTNTDCRRCQAWPTAPWPRVTVSWLSSASCSSQSRAGVRGPGSAARRPHRAPRPRTSASRAARQLSSSTRGSASRRDSASASTRAVWYWAAS